MTLGAEEIPRYYVFSKADRLAKLPSKEVMDGVSSVVSSRHEHQFISNHDKRAIGELKETLLARARADLRRTKVYVPYHASKALEIVYRSCRVMETETRPSGLLFHLEAESYVIDEIKRLGAEQ